MPPTAIPNIVCASGGGTRSDLADAIQAAGMEVHHRPLEANEANGIRADLYVIDVGTDAEKTINFCRQLRSATDSYAPILLLTANTNGFRRSSLDAGADLVIASPSDPEDLIAQIRALLRIKERHDQLAAKAAEAQRTSQRLQQAYQQIDLELQLARRVQESFLPQTLPQLPKVRFAVEYRPCERVGGDFYDVFRLDEEHVGLYVADAMGHGVPASLLTIFIKTSVKAKEISGNSYRLVPPDEVLQALNRDIRAQALSEAPFITMAYAVVNWRTGLLRFARAGHPYPLHLPRDGPPALLQIEGSLLGVFDTRYRIQSQPLAPGDKLVLYTDGMDGAGFAQHPVGLPSLLAAAEEYRRLPIEEFVRRLASDLFSQTRQHDDLTVFGLEML